MADRPQPVLTRAGIVTAISALSALLVYTDAGPVASWLHVNQDMVAGVILAAAPIVTGYLARRHVTPLSAPVSSDGTQLVPVQVPAYSVPVLPAEAALAAADVIHAADAGTPIGDALAASMPT